MVANGKDKCDIWFLVIRLALETNKLAKGCDVVIFSKKMQIPLKQ